MAVSFSIGLLPFLAPSIDNADLLFALVTTTGFYLHHMEVADYGPASGSLQADHKYYIF